MRNKSVGMRIARGSLVGIFTGVVAGIGIPTAMNWDSIMENKEKIALAIGDKVIETFSDGDIYDGSTDDIYDSDVLQYEDFAGDVDLDSECVENAGCSLEDVILRFHVRANSSSEEDLALKLEVRDAVLVEMSRLMHVAGIGNNMALEDTVLNYTEVEEVENSTAISTAARDEILDFLAEHLENIEDTAEEVIKNNGYDYVVKAYISEDYFPIRQYGELCLPAGNYTALRVDIGEAAGDNFWCLLYPTMCYTVDSEAFVSKEGEDKLEQALTEEDYDRLFVKKNLEKGELRIKSKLFEWLGL